AKGRRDAGAAEDGARGGDASAVVRHARRAGEEEAAAAADREAADAQRRRGRHARTVVRAAVTGRLRPPVTGRLRPPVARYAQTRLRPEAFASYSRSSARLMIAAASITSASIAATPIEMVTGMRVFSNLNSVFSTIWRIFSANGTALAPSISGSTIANSSPP